jgi:hypothetical protein
MSALNEINFVYLSGATTLSIYVQGKQSFQNNQGPCTLTLKAMGIIIFVGKN